MSYDKVLQAKQIVKGTKQTVKAIKKGIVREVIIAKDAEPRVIAEVVRLAEEMQIPITYVDSMKKLGKACGIEVGAATVALLI